MRSVKRFCKLQWYNYFQWIRYMTCDGLPDPGKPSEMNTFIFLWSMKSEEVNMSNIVMKHDTVIFVSVFQSNNILNTARMFTQRATMKMYNWTIRQFYTQRIIVNL